ncbi:MAG: pyruvate kinase [Acidimicrobiales bacterium]|nr:pyruvate kinase [Acidimicrobiaceae bacterium]MDP6076948.1 pyruvate kinase [Acidimicrobiales bacterium]HCV35366.1 pyruvate kinase [Acidimicrobiaceae bacterium]HJO79631.1 pyruvate kinase [Acidimicrobiales bacterium]
MARRTKIIATIGPASEDVATLRNLIRAGMDVARLGLAHGTLDEAAERLKLIRRLSAEEGKPVGILVDLPGPKVRAASFGEKPLSIIEKSEIRLSVGRGQSTAEVMEVDYDGLLEDVQAGDRLSIGDGRVILKVTETSGDHLLARVMHGGTLTGRPGVHVPSDRLSMTAPTAEDLLALEYFLELDIDMVAVSFVRSVDDLRRLPVEQHPAGPLVVAKIETRAAVDDLAAIIGASGAIMVARGDLGNECRLEELPILQKEIIRECIALGRPAITATQMLETMISNPEPTRAEVSDVANAVWDGSSAVMLSGETAIGSDPANVVATMSRIAERADDEFDHRSWASELSDLRLTNRNDPESAITDAMTMAAARALAELRIRTVLCISGSGFTVRSMARFRPEAKILGFSADKRTVGQLTLSWGTEPLHLAEQGNIEERVAAAVVAARDAGHVEPGELVGVLAGTNVHSRSTNVLRLEIVSSAC